MRKRSTRTIADEDNLIVQGNELATGKKSESKHGLDDVVVLVRGMQSKMRLLIWLVGGLAVLVVFLCIIIGVLTDSLTVRDQRRSVTIDALAAFAANNNCVNQRGERFDDSIIKILDTLTVEQRRTVIKEYNAIEKCPDVELPGVPTEKTERPSTTTTTKEKP